jgi:hypothetical protein
MLAAISYRRPAHANVAMPQLVEETLPDPVTLTRDIRGAPELYRVIARIAKRDHDGLPHAELLEEDGVDVTEGYDGTIGRRCDLKVVQLSGPRMDYARFGSRSLLEDVISDQ